MKASAGTLTRRFVKVALPTGHTGVGAALRLAFRIDAGARSPRRFEEILERLD